ncbi:MAG: NlpC/P60 family N-terminal domain-containing protein [Sulfurimonas sp.]|nr:NlpC/P60 family N-terminal domain-containing protein [Sulfurimonas sp.]
MKYIFTLGMALLMLGCAHKEEPKVVFIPQKKILAEVDKELEEAKKIVIQDLVNIPQNIETYTSYIKDEFYMINKNYEDAYFSMWNIERPTQGIEAVNWPFKYFDTTKSYGENLLAIKESFFDVNARTIKY